MSKKAFCYEYPRPAVTVDIVLATREIQPRVLLIQRKKEPFAGRWALPGGFVELDETLEESARRELREETGLSVGRMEQLYTYGDPRRDPRGRVISVAFLARVSAGKLQPKAADDAANAGWFPLQRPPALAFDHAKILAFARRQLRLKRSK
ncbi:MAG: NUDIX hydrolase [Gemmataceae bacterium]|nr:NUDIX hydrolase [Gemmataceae bacterium]MCI0738653.1 NUDIX hydrolase [Gemmataceae bacterium]